MKLLRHSYSLSQGCVATIGSFDGIHRGHAALLQLLVVEAKQRHLPSVVILFEPQPREFFAPEQAPVRLTSLREKLRLLKKFDIDYVVCLRFNSKLAQLQATDFVLEILVKQLQVKYILIGDDFRFGKQRLGDFTLLQTMGAQYNFTVASMHTLQEDNERISSTMIRESLVQGDLAKAQRALGHPFHLSGRVRRGAGRGRQWGFPTANVAVPRYGLPLSGVFVVRVNSNQLKSHPAVANIGTRPTVDGTRTVLEVLLLDFNDDLYGQRLEIEFLQKLRDEKKFDTVELLLAQIAKDVEEGKEFFKLHPCESKTGCQS